MACKSHQNVDNFDPYNRCEGFLIIDSFFLVVTLNHQPDLVPNDCSKLIKLVLEHSLSTNDWSFLRPCYKMSYLVSFKLMQLLLHCSNLIRICMSFMNILWLNIREKSIESTKVFEFRSGLHSCINVRHNLVKRVQTLVLLRSWNNWIHEHAFQSFLGMWRNRLWICFGTCS